MASHFVPISEDASPMASPRSEAEEGVGVEADIASEGPPRNRTPPPPGTEEEGLALQRSCAEATGTP